MTTGYITWTWNGEAIRVGCDRFGEGPTVLLLPAFSSISTRGEMKPLQESLAREFATVNIDWPGFGTEPRYVGNLLPIRAFCDTSLPKSLRAHSRP